MESGRFMRTELPPRAHERPAPEIAVWMRRLAAVVASSNDAILTKDPTGRITSWNAGAERLYGYRAAEAIGQPITILIPPERRGEELEILRAIMAGERIEHYDTERVRQDGDLISVALSISPVRDEHGAIVEASVIARDVTAARRADLQRDQLQAVTAALSEAASAQDVVDVVLREGFEAAEAQAAVVALPVPGSARVELLGLRGYSEAVVRELRRMTVDDPTPLAEALRTGRPVWLEGDELATSDSVDSERYAVPRDTALVGLPLVVQGRTIGAVGLRLDRGRRIDDAERRFMLTLAGQCAQALDRARLFEAERDARRRAEFLARAGSLLAGSLNVRATLEQVARLAVPELADWAFVRLLDGDRSVTREIVVHTDPDGQDWARVLAEHHTTDRGGPALSDPVIRSGEPALLAEVTDEFLASITTDAEQLEVLRQVGFSSGMVVPLRARGRVLGALTLALARSDRRFGGEDLAMAQELADRCALALDNALLFAERSYIAKTLQEGLLPADLPEIPRVELAVRYRAATQEADVGGDFYDVFAAGGGWVFVTGDVVGKGAKAAAITGLARHTLRAAALYEQSPAQMLRVLNRAMLEQFTDDEQFCTVAITFLHGRELRVASGGHPLPLVLRAGGDVHTAGRSGSLIGVLPDPVLHESSCEIAPGDTIVLYTDGVTEARGAEGRFGADRLAAVLAMSVALAPGQIVERIDRAVAAFRSGAPTDDAAIVAFRPIADHDA